MNRLRPFVGLWLILVGLVVPAWVAAEDAVPPAGAPPAINRQYENPDYEQWVQAFERPGREVYDRRREIVAASGVKPGMALADIGAGTGLFTRLFAREVGPQGKVYAVDISQVFIDNIRRTSREQGLANVEGVVSTQTATRLAPGAIDLAFVCDAYHHFENPQAMLRSLHRALRSGGALVVIDFQRIHGHSSAWVMGHVRAGKEPAIREIEAEGFKLAEDSPLLRENFFLRFQRSERR